MTTHERKGCTSHLVLVAPPISNTIAAQITPEDQDAIDLLRASHFYMICGRPKASFTRVTVDEDGGFIEIGIKLDSGVESYGHLYFPRMKFFESAPEDFHLSVRSDSTLFRLFQDDHLVFATDPDDLLMRRGRKQSFIHGFDNYREMQTFDLLYVGIAKKNQDSYSRLIERGHKARMDILSAEPQRFPGARVSDETYLLLFAIAPLILTTFGANSTFDEDDLDFSYDYHRIVADAEKAVINVFQPKYNREKYKNYPHGRDGLYEQGYDAYTYAIAEGFSFVTQFGVFKGARSTEELLLSNDADFISVMGDTVTLNISGKDFNVPVDSDIDNA